MSTGAVKGRDISHSWTLRVVTWAYALGLAAILSLWGCYVTRQPSLLAYSYRYDFLCGYVGARAVSTGNSSRLYDLSEQRTLTDTAIAPYHRDRLLPFVYPAFVALLLEPLGLLSYTRAFVVWDVINLAVAAILTWRLSRLVSTRRERLAFSVLAWASVPWLLTLLHAQFGMLPALGLGETLIALRKGRGNRAGAWLLLGLVKPQLILAVLIALLLWRCWRTVVTFLAGTCLVAGVSFAILGFWIPAYLKLLADFERAGEKLSLYPAAMQNWRGAASVAFGPHARSATLLLTAASIILVLLLARRRSQWELRLAAIIVLGLLLSPHLYMHDLVMVVPAGFFLYLGLGSDKSLRAQFLRSLLAAAPAVFFLAQAAHLGRLQIVPWFLLLLVGLTLVSVQRKRLKEPELSLVVESASGSHS